MTKIIINETTGVSLKIDGMNNTVIVKTLLDMGVSIGRTSVRELVAGKRIIAAGFKIIDQVEPIISVNITKRRGRKPLNGVAAMSQKEIQNRAYAKRKLVMGTGDMRGRPQLNQTVLLNKDISEPRFNGGENNKMFAFYGLIKNGMSDYNSLTSKMQESNSQWQRSDTINSVTYLSNRGLVSRENPAKYSKKL